MKVTVIKPTIPSGSFPVSLELEPNEARLLCEFLSKTNRSIEADLLGISCNSFKIVNLDMLLFGIYKDLHTEGY